MHYIVYKITNQINGKFYIGVHKTKNIDDGYMGSGKHLKRAQAKYGIENFKKEVLFVFDNAKDMYHKEAEIVDENFVNSDETYNLMEGGLGGFEYINANPEKFLTEKRLSALMPVAELLKRWKAKWDSDPSFRKEQSERSKKQIQLNLQKNPNGLFFGRKHTQAAKERIGKANSITQSGSGNSQYGTRWIYSLTEKISKKKIQKDQPLPDGWFEGRKIKFK